MTKAELAWLNFAYDMMRDKHSACACEPYADGGFRWPGYVGSNYKGVLFVGARHNASGLRKAGLNVGPLGRYAKELRKWVSLPRTDNGDRELLDAMRSGYRHSYYIWTSDSVWRIFQEIRDWIGLTWDDVASVNLARCYSAETNTGDDDAHILSHSTVWSLDRIVTALQPKLVFVSKDKNDSGLRAALSITSEDIEMPLVTRFSNYGTGVKNGDRYSVWIPKEYKKWRAILGMPATP